MRAGGPDCDGRGRWPTSAWRLGGSPPDWGAQSAEGARSEVSGWRPESPAREGFGGWRGSRARLERAARYVKESTVVATRPVWPERSPRKSDRSRLGVS